MLILSSFLHLKVSLFSHQHWHMLYCFVLMCACTRVYVCACVCMRVFSLTHYLSPAISLFDPHGILKSCLIYSISTLCLIHSSSHLFPWCLGHLTHLSTSCSRTEPSFCLRILPYLGSLSLLHPQFPPVTDSLIMGSPLLVSSLYSARTVGVIQSSLKTNSLNRSHLSSWM